jgi:GGDEF domain-containing protein
MNRQDASFSLIYFDLDRFKPVNDLWGHERETRC